MLTNQQIEAGQPLLKVPRALFITHASAQQSPLCGTMVTKAELGEWQVSQLSTIWLTS